MGDTELRLRAAERQVADQAATIHRLHAELVDSQRARRIAVEALEAISRRGSLAAHAIARLAMTTIEQGAPAGAPVDPPPVPVESDHRMMDELRRAG